MKAEHISIALNLEQIPNVTRKTAALLREAGIALPVDLKAQDACLLYDKICQITRRTHELQLIDVLLSAIDFSEGNAPRHWSSYTPTRNALLNPNKDRSKK